MTPEMYHQYFREYENDPDLCPDRAKYVHYVYSGERADRYIRRQAGLKRIPLAIMLGDEIVGEILLKNIEERRSATLIPVLYADALRTNTRSQYVLEKAGFTLTGEDEDFKYYRIDRPAADPPAAP